MRLYDGENVEGFNAQDLQELKEEYPDEGMSGIDPRYVINRISSAIIRKQLTSINALDEGEKPYWNPPIAAGKR